MILQVYTYTWGW